MLQAFTYVELAAQTRGICIVEPHLADAHLYWQRAPAVLESKDQNAVMGGKCSELSAACGYECSGIHLHINLWECRSHGSDEADSWESTRS